MLLFDRYRDELAGKPVALVQTVRDFASALSCGLGFLSVCAKKLGSEDFHLQSSRATGQSTSSLQVSI